MPEYLAPGVYVEEIEIGGKPIEGVSTSTAAFVGEAERGPLEPRFVTSTAEYERLYGAAEWIVEVGGEARPSTSYLPHAVAGFFANGGKRAWVVRVAGQNPGEAKLDLGAFELVAAGPGTWSNRLRARLKPGSRGGELRMLELILWHDKPDANDAFKTQPLLHEQFDNLSTEPASPDYYEKQLRGASELVRLAPKAGGNWQNPDDDKLRSFTKVDADAPADVLAFTGGADPPRGLAALADLPNVSIVAIPNEKDFNGQLTTALVDHCENHPYRVAVLNAPKGAQPGSVAAGRSSDMAAFYYPWIRVTSPSSGRPMLVPPCGHVAGIWARSDVERGVHKAPANEVVRGALGLDVPVTHGEQQRLNPKGVNCIRAFPGRGILVWGARTTSSDPAWKYLNVRRLFLYLEASIERATQWVVFEPNNERLWARVRQTISGFLTQVWKDGALMGGTPDEAFYVRCDRSTMTQNDIDNGRLICEIGVAPVKPAEFVVFRLAQWSGGSEVTE